MGSAGVTLSIVEGKGAAQAFVAVNYYEPNVITTIKLLLRRTLVRL
jgi:hypothetical protein